MKGGPKQVRAYLFGKVADMVTRPTQLEARRFKEGQWHERAS
jgi:hypothetical protein